MSYGDLYRNNLIIFIEYNSFVFYYEIGKKSFFSLEILPQIQLTSPHLHLSLFGGAGAGGGGEVGGLSTSV